MPEQPEKLNVQTVPSDLIARGAQVGPSLLPSAMTDARPRTYLAVMANVTMPFVPIDCVYVPGTNHTVPSGKARRSPGEEADESLLGLVSL
jgi:hypothetical protein